MFYQQCERVFTEEQLRILEETELDKRKIFFGAAGTGKTFIAIEKAKQLALKGKKVFLTCFNKGLANKLFKGLDKSITSANFHGFIETLLKEQGFQVDSPKDSKSLQEYFDNTLPSMAFEYFSSLSEEEKFDGIIVDEGQDFKEEWIICLESALKSDGEFYIFADPNQNLFNTNLENIKRMPISKHKLTRNFRNTEEINSWIMSLFPEAKTKSFISGGFPVKYFTWKNPDEERSFIEKEVGRLVSQGIQPYRITILSPHKKEKSSLSGKNKIKEWNLIDAGDKDEGNGIRFSTIRSFKGLESDIVFLIGIKKGSRVCTDTDIYVGGSRARFLLYVFHEIDWLI